MNTKEHKALLKSFKAYSKKVTSTKSEAKNFLIRSGIHNTHGNLSQNYTLSGSK